VEVCFFFFGGAATEVKEEFESVVPDLYIVRILRFKARTRVVVFAWVGHRHFNVLACNMRERNPGKGATEQMHTQYQCQDLAANVCLRQVLGD